MDRDNPSDVYGVLETLGEPEIAWWADMYPLWGVEAAQEFISWGNENKKGITQYAVYGKESGKMLGIVQVKRTHVPDICIAELGYAMSYEGRGKGYMTEAVKAVCGMLFEDPVMTEIRCEILPFNEGSLGVATRCGFARVEKKWYERDTRNIDDYYLEEYVLKANEYRKRKAGFDFSYLDRIAEEEDLYEQLAA